jgi:hypothetical protein
MNKIVITLTTVPSRLLQDVEDGFQLVVKSLCEQNYDNYEVHLNIPNIYNVTNEEYTIPTWLSEFETEYKQLKIFRVEDVGPPTKVVPTIKREDPNTLLIVVDDDLVYHPDMINEHIKYHNLLDNSVILYDGRNLVSPKYNDLRDSWVLSVNEILRVRELQHYKSASYFVSYFESDFFDSFFGKTLSDDVLMSYYFKHKDIPMYVVPYEPDISNIYDYDSWYFFQGVTTFPVLRHSNSVIETGCNHPEMLKKEPKFFIPEEFKTIDRKGFLLKHLDILENQVKALPNNNNVMWDKIQNDIIKKSSKNMKDIHRVSDLILGLAEDFNKIEKSFWGSIHLTGEEHDTKRSKPAPYIKKTCDLAKILGLRTVVEIGATRHGITPDCVNYFYNSTDPFVSPPCCADGHAGIFFTLEGFDVYSVDIDENCSTHINWSFEALGRSLPNNLELHIPKDGLEFISEFDKEIDILFLDGWDVGAHNYMENHLAAFILAQEKLSDIHLILIDDTDFTTNEGKDALLSPHLISLGYTLLFDGRQKLYINKI